MCSSSSAPLAFECADEDVINRRGARARGGLARRARATHENTSRARVCAAFARIDRDLDAARSVDVVRILSRCRDTSRRRPSTAVAAAVAVAVARMDECRVRAVVERCQSALGDARAALLASERENQELKLELAATRAALEERRLASSRESGASSSGLGLFADASVREAVVRALARAGMGDDGDEDEDGGRLGRRRRDVRRASSTMTTSHATRTTRPSIASVIDDIGPVPLSPSPLKK